MKDQLNAKRLSDREIVSSRAIGAPIQSVFRAWAEPAIFQKWWVPKDAPITLNRCEMDVREGGRYRLVFRAGDQNAEFFGRYLEVNSPSRLVWTNEEGGADNATITTITFEEVDSTTLVTVHDLYASKEALDEEISTGATAGMPVQLAQLAELLLDKKAR